ncbi:MAG: isochorismatase family cysteine hydrolase [Haloarculaceae archaeon]
MGDEPNLTAVEYTPDQAALVLIEFQKQWTGDTLYNRLIRRSLTNRNVIERTRQTVRAARDTGITVVHAPLVCDPEDKHGWLATLTRARVFTKGTPKAEFTPGIYEDGDEVVEGRHTFDAFEGSDLATILDENDIQTVFFAGFTTDQCVASSFRTAREAGRDAYVLGDLTATWNGIVQRRYERKFGDRCVSSAVIRPDGDVTEQTPTEQRQSVVS